MRMLTVRLPYLLGALCSSDTEISGSDLTSVSLFSHAAVHRVTFPLVLDALKLHQTYPAP